ncbi:MAG: class II aldolase/adducin family protein [Pseudomonadota bacterium]
MTSAPAAASKPKTKRKTRPRAMTALCKEIIGTCLEMNAVGINQGTSGNVSARSGDGFLITPSGIPYAETSPDQIVEMDLEGGYIGDWLPSSEWRMHMDLFKARPEAQAIVHTHSTYAAALSCLRVDVPAFHYMIGVTGGTTLRCSEYATFGTQALSDAMLVALKDRTACLLANHGMICFGPSLSKALWLAGEVETLCKQYYIACQAGMPVVLDDAEMTGVLARFKTYGKQPKDLVEGDAPAVEAPTRRDV